MSTESKGPLSHYLAGGILGLIMVVYSIVLSLIGETMNRTLANVSYLLLLVGIIYIVIQYAKSVDHDTTFGKLFSYGMKVSALVTIIILVYSIIYFQIFPDTKEMIFDKMREEMIKQGQVSDEQIDQSVNFMRKYFNVFFIGGGIFMTMIMGLIGSLIGAAVAKKNPSTPFQG